MKPEKPKHSICTQIPTGQLDEEGVNSPIATSPTPAIWDVQLTIRENALDDGTFEKLLRLCKASDIEVSVTPMQISARGLAPPSGSRDEHAFESSAADAQGTRLDQHPAPSQMTTCGVPKLAAIPNGKEVRGGGDYDHTSGSPDLDREERGSSMETLIKPYLKYCQYLLTRLKPVCKYISFGQRLLPHLY